jgi:hypothetical protein
MQVYPNAKNEPPTHSFIMFKNKHYLPLEWSSVGQIIKKATVATL